MFMGGTNVPDLSFIAITAPNGTVFITVSRTGDLGPETGSPVRPEVGSVMTLTGAATPGSDHVIVVGHFTDEAVNVLLDTFV